LSLPSRLILAQNAGRDPDRLALKLARMRQDAFAFFRGTNPLFLEYLPPRHPLLGAPSTLICGDLHLENFGAFKGDNRLCYFDVNDFDEACLAPFTLDIVRFVAGVALAAEGFGLSSAQGARLSEAFLDAYTVSIADGKPRWIERTLAEGVFRTLLRRAMRRTRRQLLDRLSTVKGGSRRLLVDGKRTLPLRPAQLARLQRFLKAHAATQGRKRSFFKLIDAARRVAGNGSLGLPRDILLVQGRGSPDENYLLDLKFAAPSAVAVWRGGAQPAWPSEAARVVAIQRIVQAISPAWLNAVNFDGGPFVLKELQPVVDRFDLTRWHGKPRRMVEAVQGMGRCAAWAHLRGCGHYGAASAEALQAFVLAERWQSAATRLAVATADRVHAAWVQFAEDYDAGAVQRGASPGAAAARPAPPLKGP
jgi:uncharacterized protein (DUF2252 family)